ncbi:MAG: PKD domain-containing protein [Bacteroidetes bacterium]|nr:PKD domain-containing protein [Bacteroidota bacterium]
MLSASRNGHSSPHLRTLLLALVIAASPLLSQEVFLSVSGNQALIKETGDNTHQYDFWIKPESGAASAALHIFDAGLGGVADIIAGPLDTRTTFELIPFDALYTYANGRLTVTARTARPSVKLTTLDEQQYFNRWKRFSMLETGSKNGWILRVRAADGNDVNSFQLQVGDSVSVTAQRNDWSIIAIDLSICLYRVAPTAEMQLRPYMPAEGALVGLTSAGEEQVMVGIRDEFGNASKLPVPKGFFVDPLANGMRNSWGLTVSGSPLKVNNLVIKGAPFPVLWDLKPTIVRQPQKPLAEVIQSAGSDCNNVLFTLTEASRKNLSGIAPKWSFGRTVTEKDSAEIGFGKPGKYSVSLFLPTRGVYFPKFWQQDVPVTVNAAPNAVITADKLIAAPGEIVTLSAANSADPENAPLRYQWFVNGEFRSDEKVLTLSSLLPTTYDVMLTVNDGAPNSGCTESSARKKVRINAQPYVDVNFRPIFGRSTVVPFVVENDADNDNDELEFLWNGPGIVGTTKGDAVKIKHDKAGTYSLSLTANDRTNTSNSTFTQTIKYRVNAEPLPSFTLPKQAAPGDTLLLSASVFDEDNPAVAFTWSSTAGHSFTGEKADLAFAQPGDYRVTLTADDGENVENSVQSISRDIHINAPPVPVITADSRSTSARQRISAERTTDADQKELVHSWDFGDGTSAVGRTVIHEYQQSGRYLITLTVDDRQRQTNSVQRTTHELVINRYPVAQFTLPTKWEPGKPLMVDGTRSSDPDGSVAEYTWYINGTEAAKGPNPSLVFDTPGDHAVALKVKDNSGFVDAVGMKTLSIHINYPPVVRWKMVPEVAEPNVPVTFDATASTDKETKNLTAARWTFSDGSTAEGLKVTRTFSRSGMITASVTVDDGGGYANSAQTLQKNVLVNAPPIIVTKTLIRTNSRRVLLDASQSYDIDKHAVGFEWLLPDRTRVNKAAFTWDAPSGGVHFITVTANDGQGRKNSITRETVKILVNRPPVAVVDTLIYSCTGQTILFNGSLSYDPDGDAVTTTWDFGDGTTTTETNPAHTYRSPGYYTVKLLLDDGFAEQPTTATIPVIVEGSPVAYQTFADTTICVNVPLDFDGTRSIDPNGPIGSYTWDFGDGIASLGASVSHAYTKPGIYYATLTVVGSGSGRCTKVSQVTSTVRVIEGPTANFAMPERVSIGELVSFDPALSKPNGRILSVRWKIGTDTVITYPALTQAQYRFRRSGTYDIELTISIQSTSTCNSATLTRKIIVNEPPAIVWNVPADAALGDPLVLDASRSSDQDGIIAQYDWRIDGRSVGSTPIVTAANLAAGTHTVALTVTDNSGTSTRSVSKQATVRINSKPNPTFSLAEPLYQNELVMLRPEMTKDADGDALTFRWKVNDLPVTADSIRLAAGRTIITLTADDGRNVRNSKDSVQKEYFVIAAPALDIDLPSDWIVGTELNAQQLYGNGTVNFGLNVKVSPTWTPLTAGPQSATVVWTPKGQPLARHQWQLTVWDSLDFTERPAPQTIIWNPSNPSIILTAPGVNRPKEANVLYEWRKGNQVFGVGKVAEGRLVRGRNVFTVRAMDQEMQGAHPRDIEIVVICE